jgi:dethiobiotin synthetase
VSAPAFFVTGTDTGIGKTLVSCALLAAARARGLAVGALKPIETGCPGPPGALAPADAIALHRAAGGLSTTGAPPTSVYRFAAPLAPSVAAEREGAIIDFAPILGAADRLRERAPDLLLVEGAGGLLVPITDALDMADLAAALALPLLVVARDGLGTINHTLLTLAVAGARGLSVAGVVLNGSTPGTSGEDAARNAVEIERRGKVRVLGRLPHLADTSFTSLTTAAATHLDLESLLSPLEF